MQGMSVLKFKKSFEIRILIEDMDMDADVDMDTDTDMDMDVMESSKKLHVERMCVSTGGFILAWKVDDA